MAERVMMAALLDQILIELSMYGDCIDINQICNSPIHPHGFNLCHSWVCTKRHGEAGNAADAVRVGVEISD